jgi:cytochrome c5
MARETMMPQQASQARQAIFAAIIVFACSQSVRAQAVAKAETSPSVVPSKRATLHPDAAPDKGEQKFRQNCSRCHNAPEQLSPRITGTVMMHMRMRANLSAADQLAILHYLAP